MTTDKPLVGIMIKITCVLMLVIFIFTSCASKNDENIPFIPIEDIKDSDEVVEIPEIDAIRIIIGRNESLEMIATAEELCEQLTAVVGKSAYISYEGDKTATDGETEIWLGYQSTVAAQNLMREMRSDDFMCREIDGVIVMGGRSIAATANAVERFCKEILLSATKYRLIPENGGFEHVGEYEVDRALINGVLVKNFEIVIESRNDSELLGSALYLQSSISDKTGYWLDIVEENDRKFESNGLILKRQSGLALGDERVLSTQYGVELVAEDKAGLIECVDSFVSMFSQGPDEGSLYIEFDSEIRTEYFFTDFTVASMRLDECLPFSSALTLATVMKEALESRPDILLTGKLSEDDGNTVLKNLQGYYAVKDKNGEIYGYAKNISCEFISVTDGGDIVKEYYTVEKDDVRILLVRISGSPTDASVYTDISQTAIESGLPIAILSQTDSQSVSERLPENFSKNYSEYTDYRNGRYYFECYTADTEFSEVELTKKGTGIIYREIRINVAA